MTFGDKGYLPGLAHQFVNTVMENPNASYLRAERGNYDDNVSYFFGLDGKGSQISRQVETDAKVLEAARGYCAQYEPEFLPKFRKIVQNVPRPDDVIIRKTLSQDAGQRETLSHD